MCYQFVCEQFDSQSGLQLLTAQYHYNVTIEKLFADLGNRAQVLPKPEVNSLYRWNMQKCEEWIEEKISITTSGETTVERSQRMKLNQHKFLITLWNSKNCEWFSKA